jgi:PilZ domain-containing protein
METVVDRRSHASVPCDQLDAVSPSAPAPQRTGPALPVDNAPGDERRRWPRFSAASLGNMAAAITGGPSVALVNVSRGGALLESTERFPLCSQLRLRLRPAQGDEIVASARVVWAKVASIEGSQIIYRIALAFDANEPHMMDHSPADAAAAGSACERADDAATPTTTRQNGAPQIDVSRNESEDGRAAGMEIERLRTLLDAALADLDSERQCREQQRSTFERQIADANGRASMLEATVLQHQAETEKLREQQVRCDALIDQLAQKFSDQQTLVGQLTAARDEYRDRADRLAVELDRHATETHRKVAESDMHIRALQRRLDAAETLCRAHDARHQMMRCEAERLLSIAMASLSLAGGAQDNTPLATAGREPHEKLAS